MIKSVTTILNKISCFLGLHDQEILEIRDEGGCRRALLQCKHCDKLYHALIAGRFQKIAPLARMPDMKMYWGIK